MHGPRRPSPYRCPKAAPETTAAPKFPLMNRKLVQARYYRYAVGLSEKWGWLGRDGVRASLLVKTGFALRGNPGYRWST